MTKTDAVPKLDLIELFESTNATFCPIIKYNITKVIDPITGIDLANYT
jgi:hypothetical protein